MMKHPLLWLLLVLSSVGFMLYSNVTSSTDDPQAAPMKRVRIAEAQSQQRERKPTFAGVVRAKNRASLAFSDSSGRLMQRTVNTGASVRAGQVLAKLDSEAYQHAVDAAQANIADLEARVAQNRRDVQRVQTLLNKQAATAEELEMQQSATDSLAANLDAARVQLSEAQRRLKETTLFAPFAGIITETFMEPGEFATPGRPVMMISGSQGYEIEIEVPESLLAALSPNQQVNIRFPLQNDREVIGTIFSIGQASQQSRLFPVLIQPKADSGLIAGMSAEVTLSITENQTTTIPVQAVINPGGQHPVVFRLNGTQVERVSIDVGGLMGEQIAIEGALTPGDTVVIGGHAGLVDGDTVEVLR